MDELMRCESAFDIPQGGMACRIHVLGDTAVMHLMATMDASVKCGALGTVIVKFVDEAKAAVLPLSGTRVRAGLLDVNGKHDLTPWNHLKQDLGGHWLHARLAVFGAVHGIYHPFSFKPFKDLNLQYNMFEDVNSNGPPLPPLYVTVWTDDVRTGHHGHMREIKVICSCLQDCLIRAWTSLLPCFVVRKDQSAYDMSAAAWSQVNWRSAVACDGHMGLFNNQDVFRGVRAHLRGIGNLQEPKVSPSFPEVAIPMAAAFMNVDYKYPTTCMVAAWGTAAATMLRIIGAPDSLAKLEGLDIELWYLEVQRRIAEVTAAICTPDLSVLHEASAAWAPLRRISLDTAVEIENHHYCGKRCQYCPAYCTREHLGRGHEVSPTDFGHLCCQCMRDLDTTLTAEASPLTATELLRCVVAEAGRCPYACHKHPRRYCAVLHCKYGIKDAGPSAGPASHKCSHCAGHT